MRPCYLERLEAERRRADDLLHAILPPGAVQELKASNTVRPRRYEDVAVLFCDVADFTAYCERNPPEQVVAELQALVERFEEIADRHGLEKIKTVGDAFLATAGLLRRAEGSGSRCRPLRTRYGRGGAITKPILEGPRGHPPWTGCGRDHRSAAIPVRPLGRYD